MWNFEKLSNLEDVLWETLGMLKRLCEIFQINAHTGRYAFQTEILKGNKCPGKLDPYVMGDHFPVREESDYFEQWEP